MSGQFIDGEFLWKNEERNVLWILAYFPYVGRDKESHGGIYRILQYAEDHCKIKRTDSCRIQESIPSTLEKNDNVQIIGFTSASCF